MNGFGIHPSEKLNVLYQKKAYQGQDPYKAKILFLSLDANWDYDIEQSPAWPYVIEYLQDGVAFWKKYEIHHPMLLDTYQGSGKTFHRSFQQLGLDSGYAEKISFIELYGKPTYGVSSKDAGFKDMVINQDTHYLDWLKDILLNSEGKTIFTAKTVYKFLYENQNAILGQRILKQPDYAINAADFTHITLGINTLIPVYHFSYIPVYMGNELREPYYTEYRNQIDSALK
ncbi:hypothetical protein FJZ33_03430 [Candidatus Poribacteria bacterium]|nr:hypothetical protein [Candidatus Poribacteria bacterium]